MKNKRQFKASLIFLSLAFILPALAYAGYDWYKNHIEPLPYFGKYYAIESKNAPHSKIPQFSFTDQDGMPVNNSFLNGHVCIVHYFFTSCPTICPLMVANLKGLHTEISNNDLRILSLTVDPAHDTVKRLKRYATTKQIDDSDWKLVTGTKQQLYLFARKGLSIDATDGDGGAGDFIHSEKLVLIDQEQHIRGYYDGTDKTDVNRLKKDIYRLFQAQKN